MATIVEMLQEISFEELLRSYDVKVLDQCRLIYEDTEEYEKCALLRDRIKILNDANNNRLSK